MIAVAASTRFPRMFFRLIGGVTVFFVSSPCVRMAQVFNQGYVQIAWFLVGFRIYKFVSYAIPNTNTNNANVHFDISSISDLEHML